MFHSRKIFPDITRRTNARLSPRAASRRAANEAGGGRRICRVEFKTHAWHWRNDCSRRRAVWPRRLRSKREGCGGSRLQIVRPLPALQHDIGPGNPADAPDFEGMAL